MSYIWQKQNRDDNTSRPPVFYSFDEIWFVDRWKWSSTDCKSVQYASGIFYYAVIKTVWFLYEYDGNTSKHDKTCVSVSTIFQNQWGADYVIICNLQSEVNLNTTVQYAFDHAKIRPILRN